ncbi:MAG: hypothetical protein HFE64_04920 [Lachnospiraceae bacterium]|jgi:hypothetical protein|nr:hypothetical protein [Lachnospiraceae bacterium]
MNGKRMTVIILILLLCLNLFLCGYYVYQRDRMNRVPAEKIQQIVNLYEENQIDFAFEPEGESAQGRYLLLGEADLDKLAETVLDTGYDKSYIYGSKVQYRAGSVTVITDWQKHQIVYTDETGEPAEKEKNSWQEKELSEEERQQLLLPIARSFAQKWLGEQVYFAESERREDKFYFVFCQMREGAVLYFNQIEIYMAPQGVTSAVLTYWGIEGESEKSYNLLPMDEILYAQLGMIKKEMKEDTRETVVQVLEGYELASKEKESLGVPALTIVLESGKKYRMRQLE